MDETVYSEIMKTLAVMDISSIDKVESDDTIDVELPTRSLRNRSVSESSLHKTRNRKVRKQQDISSETNFLLILDRETEENCERTENWERNYEFLQKCEQEIQGKLLKTKHRKLIFIF